MQCTRCGADNPTAKQFCGDCGAALDADVRNASGGEIPPSITGASGDIAWLRKVYELGNAFAERLDLDDLIPFVLARCREVLNAEGVAVLFIDAEHNQLYFPYVSEQDPEVAKRLAGFGSLPIVVSRAPCCAAGTRRRSMTYGLTHDSSPASTKEPEWPPARS